jgi:hypothetical protein
MYTGGQARYEDASTDATTRPAFPKSAFMANTHGRMSEILSVIPFVPVGTPSADPWAFGRPMPSGDGYCPD